MFIEKTRTVTLSIYLETLIDTKIKNFYKWYNETNSFIFTDGQMLTNKK